MIKEFRGKTCVKTSENNLQDYQLMQISMYYNRLLFYLYMIIRAIKLCCKNPFLSAKYSLKYAMWNWKNALKKGIYTFENYFISQKFLKYWFII